MAVYTVTSDPEKFTHNHAVQISLHFVKTPDAEMQRFLQQGVT